MDDYPVLGGRAMTHPIEKTWLRHVTKITKRSDDLLSWLAYWLFYDWSTFR
jgi:hypothetical protein